jgi:biopolymer transport protein ExbD
MAGSTQSNSGPITAINVTPLVDIILVVLIIFMATAPLIQRRAIHVDVPKAAHHERAATEAVQVVLKADGAITVAGKPMTRERMQSALSAGVAAEPELRVTFAADRVIAYSDIIAVLDLIRGAGVKKIGLEVKRQ